MTKVTGTQTEQDADTGESSEKTYTKEQVEEIVEKRVERLLTQQTKDQRAAKSKAHQDTLAAEAKWKELAELGQAESKGDKQELATLRAKVEAQEVLDAKRLKNARKGLSDPVKQMLDEMPGSPTNAEKLVWLEKHVEALQAETDKVVVGTWKAGKKVTKSKRELKAHDRPLRA